MRAFGLSACYHDSDAGPVSVVKPVPWLPGSDQLCLFVNGIPDFMGYFDAIHGAGAMLHATGSVFESTLLPIWLLAEGFGRGQERTSWIPRRDSVSIQNAVTMILCDTGRCRPTYCPPPGGNLIKLCSGPGTPA